MEPGEKTQLAPHLVVSGDQEVKSRTLNIPAMKCCVARPRCTPWGKVKGSLARVSQWKTCTTEIMTKTRPNNNAALIL